METQASYQISPPPLRRECLLPHASGWVAPNVKEIAFVLHKTGLSIEEFASLMDIDHNYARSWLEGNHKVPYALWSLLCFSAGYGQIWRWQS
ncbi:XRE family transcriptional regulator [Rahnella variigena]|uniref:XRE family transcriptional regulator n=1 Tax=Rahnella variigena TaxID=574964 RepID=UPI001330BEE9|nr:XRE family transcriptional regulator [Rahnella variigena]